MTATIITDLAQRRAARECPTNMLCRWSEAWQTVMTANTAAAFTFQRMWLRACGLQ